MNNLRIPVTILVGILLVVGAWLLIARPNHSQIARQPNIASTTADQSGSTQTPPDLNTVSSDIPGVWRSTDDQNYSVTITPDGKWTDTYKQSGPSGDVTESGTYTFFTSQNPDPAFTGTVAPGVVYIKLIEGKDTYYYSVIAVNGTDLQISYLDRGNTLSFVKVQ